MLLFCEFCEHFLDFGGVACLGQSEAQEHGRLCGRESVRGDGAWNEQLAGNDGTTVDSCGDDDRNLRLGKNVDPFLAEFACACTGDDDSLGVLDGVAQQACVGFGVKEER